MDNNDKIVNLLRRHYDENVPRPNPNLKCEELKEKLKLNPDAKNIVAEGLRRFKSPYPNSAREIGESDLDGMWLYEPPLPDFERKWGFKPPRMISFKLPEYKFSALVEKLGAAELSGGVAIDGRGFEKGSVFDGINVMIKSGRYRDFGDEHEALHGLHAEKGGSLKYVEDSLLSADDAIMAESDEKERRAYCQLVSLDVESALLGELLAYRSELSKKEAGYTQLLYHLKGCYVGAWSEQSADGMERSGMLPDCGAVSRDGARATVKGESRRYLSSKVDEGVWALKTLERCLPEPEVTRIMLSCGPSGKDLESEYLRPVDELVEWSKHYEEALAGKA